MHVDAKRFDPSNRGDVPWPVDPVFGAGHQEGIGLWLAAKSGVDSKQVPRDLGLYEVLMKAPGSSACSTAPTGG
jgi:hypothetical protein